MGIELDNEGMEVCGQLLFQNERRYFIDRHATTSPLGEIEGQLPWEIRAIFSVASDGRARSGASTTAAPTATNAQGATSARRATSAGACSASSAASATRTAPTTSRTGARDWSRRRSSATDGGAINGPAKSYLWRAWRLRIIRTEHRNLSVPL